MRILIADDDTASRMVLTAVLSKWGHEVVPTRDGAQAWEALTTTDPPSLVILDWIMPGLSGIEVCRRLRETKPGIPPYVILLTCKDESDDIVAGLQAGANDYITKPFVNQELRARLDVGQRVVELQTSLARQVSELQAALSHIKTLQGILPICMHCHSIRTDDSAWARLEAYIEEHSEVQFSHALCPECLEKYYPA